MWIERRLEERRGGWAGARAPRSRRPPPAPRAARCAGGPLSGPLCNGAAVSNTRKICIKFRCFRQRVTASRLRFRAPRLRAMLPATRPCSAIRLRQGLREPGVRWLGCSVDVAALSREAAIHHACSKHYLPLLHQSHVAAKYRCIYKASTFACCNPARGLLREAVLLLMHAKTRK